MAKTIPVGRPLRVLVLMAENDLDLEWEQLAALEFGQGYAHSDVIYDDRSSR